MSEVEGIYRLFTSDHPGPMNIGNPDEFTILELAEKVIALTGSGSRVEFRPLPTDDPKVRRPDIGLARAERGWALEEGLERTVPYFQRLVEDQEAIARAL